MNSVNPALQLRSFVFSGMPATITYPLNAKLPKGQQQVFPPFPLEISNLVFAYFASPHDTMSDLLGRGVFDLTQAAPEYSASIRQCIMCNLSPHIQTLSHTLRAYETKTLGTEDTKYAFRVIPTKFDAQTRKQILLPEVAMNPDEPIAIFMRFCTAGDLLEPIQHAIIDQGIRPTELGWVGLIEEAAIAKKWSIIHFCLHTATWDSNQFSFVKAVYCVACNDQWELVQLFLDRVPADQFSTESWTTTLLKAATKGKWSFVGKIINKFNEHRFVMASGLNPVIELAAERRRWDVVNLLLQKFIKGSDLSFNTKKKIAQLRCRPKGALSQVKLPLNEQLVIRAVEIMPRDRWETHLKKAPLSGWSLDGLCILRHVCKTHQIPEDQVINLFQGVPAELLADADNKLANVYRHEYQQMEEAPLELTPITEDQHPRDAKART